MKLKACKYDVYESQVDGEKVRTTVGAQGYHLVSDVGNSRVVNERRGLLHVYEAKKVFALLGIAWDKSFVVHHISYLRRNPCLNNLHVFNSQADHIKHHSLMERTMYNFLFEYGLLEKFYLEHPEVKLQTLKDQLLEAFKENDL
jgi:hypothetical protein